MKIEVIKKYLDNEVKILIYEEIPSSNVKAKELALNGEKEFTVVIAKRQTQGKGRLGRKFISDSENGLYMSIIFKPDLSPANCVDITVLTAVAVLEAIKETSQAFPKIKWINDIYINDRKVCGILAESTCENNKLTNVIVGVGINITPPKNGFDKEIQDIATSIFEKTTPENYKEMLCAKIIDNIIYHYNNMNKKAYMATYKEYSNIIGKEVDVYVGNEIIQGIAIDINEKAELVVKTKNNDICVFNSGEARVRKSGVQISEK